MMTVKWLSLYIFLVICVKNLVLSSRNKKFPDPSELGGDCLTGGICKDIKSECNNEQKCDCEPGFVARVLDVSFVGDMGYSACFVADGEKCVSGLLESSIPQAAFLYNREEYKKTVSASKKKLSDFTATNMDEFGRKLTDVSVIASYIREYEGEIKALEKLEKEGLVGRPSKDYGCGSGICGRDGTCGTGNRLGLFEMGGVNPRSKMNLKTSGQVFQHEVSSRMILLSCVFGIWIQRLGANFCG